jgi:hypothetical protein
MKTFLILLLWSMFSTADAKEEILPQGICLYKVSRYPCYLVKMDKSYDIVLFRSRIDSFVIAIYQLTTGSQGISIQLILESGEKI